MKNIRKQIVKTSAKINWWADLWLDLLAHYNNPKKKMISCPSKRRNRGFKLLINGAVTYSSIKQGYIIARVKSSDLKSTYRVDIKIKPFVLWNIIEACKNSCIDYDSLLTGNFPKRIQNRFIDPVYGFMPFWNDISYNCTCPDNENGTLCKHIYAAMFKVAEKIHEKPELIFILRSIDIKPLKLIPTENMRIKPIRKKNKKTKSTKKRKKKSKKQKKEYIKKPLDIVEDIIINTTKGSRRKWIQKQTGYSYKKIDNIIYELKKQNRISNKSWGLFVRSKSNPKTHINLNKNEYYKTNNA